jgi:aspartate 1-decarboxylase
MTVTITNMELKFADSLTPDQLMIEDLIMIDGEIVEVLGIASDETGDVYAVAYKTDFGDKDIVQFKYDESVSLYVYVDSDE